MKYPIGAFQDHLTSQAKNLDEMMSSLVLHESVMASIDLLIEAARMGRPILTCGNGGSAADAMHIAGELVGRFHLNRRAMNVICLNANSAVITAWANDISFGSVFARQVEAHGAEGGVLWGLSTSGNSENVVQAFEVARSMGMDSIAMTGRQGGILSGLASHSICVPGDDAPSAQNLHVILYHYMCAEIERRWAGK